MSDNMVGSGRGGQEPGPNSSSFQSRGNASRRSYGYSYSTLHRERPLREYLQVLLDYKLMIVMTTILGLVLGSHLNKNQPVYFEATALVNVGVYIPPLEGPTADALRMETSRGDYVENLLPMLESNATARYVLLTKPEVLQYVDPSVKLTGDLKKEAELAAADPATGNADAGKDIPLPVLQQYLALLTIRNRPGTNLISITAVTGELKMSAIIANAHAEAFIEMVRRQRTVYATTNVEFLNKRLLEGQTRLTEAEKALVAFAKAHSISVSQKSFVNDAPGENVDLVASRLNDAVLERIETEQDVFYKRRLLNTQGLASSTKSWEIVPKLSQLEFQIEDLRKLYPRSPVLKSMEREYKTLKDLMKQTASAEVREAERKSVVAREREASLRERLREMAKDESNRAQEKLEFSVMEREAKQSREAVERIQERLEEAQINAESDQKTVSLVDPAVGTPVAVSTRKMSTLFSGALFGFLLGVGLAFFMDQQSAPVRTPSDLAMVVEAPVLGIVPVFAKAFQPTVVEELSSEEHIPLVDPGAPPMKLKGKTAPSLVVKSAPRSRESEAFRNIRATLKFSRREGPPQIILVTSGQKGDGKTTLAVNLAASLAQTSAKTLMIDADLRIPTVHQHFNLPRETVGLGDYLTGKGTIDECILNTDIADFEVLTAGMGNGTPGELIGSRKMLDLLEQLRKKYDHIVVDTPPVGEISDALLLCRSTDGVVLVVRSGVTPKSVAQLAVERLDQVRARIIGTALNGMKAGTGITDGYTGNYNYDDKF